MSNKVFFPHILTFTLKLSLKKNKMSKNYKPLIKMRKNQKKKHRLILLNNNKKKKKFNLNKK